MSHDFNTDKGDNWPLQGYRYELTVQKEGRKSVSAVLKVFDPQGIELVWEAFPNKTSARKFMTELWEEFNDGN